MSRYEVDLTLRSYTPVDDMVRLRDGDVGMVSISYGRVTVEAEVRANSLLKAIKKLSKEVAGVLSVDQLDIYATKVLWLSDD